MQEEGLKANRETVTLGVEHLRKAYEEFIHQQQDAGVDFKFVDGTMIAHNFMKLVLHHIADEIVEQNGISNARQSIYRGLVKTAIATLQRTLEKPSSNESDITLS